jgi:hypothetical protein
MTMSEFPSMPVLIGMSWLLVAGVMAAGVFGPPYALALRGWC